MPQTKINRKRLARAIATAKGERYSAPYFAKMDTTVSSRTGKPVQATSRFAVAYDVWALRCQPVYLAYKNASKRAKR